MTLILGVESPISTNHQLYELDGGKLVLSSSTFDHGTRLSVVAKTSADWHAIRVIVAAALPDVGELTLLSAWSGSKSAMTATRAQMERMRRAKTGWNTSERGEPGGDVTLHVATRSVSLTQLALPLSSDPAAHTVLLAGPAFDPDAFVDAFLPDIAELARRSLSPSSALVRWVLQRDAAIGYHTKDDFNRLGLVLVGCLRHATKWEELPGVTRVYRDAEAGLVFQAGPG